MSGEYMKGTRRVENNSQSCHFRVTQEDLFRFKEKMASGFLQVSYHGALDVQNPIFQE